VIERGVDMSCRAPAALSEFEMSYISTTISIAPSFGRPQLRHDRYMLTQSETHRGYVLRACECARLLNKAASVQDKPK
jgi:hypothetical protein